MESESNNQRQAPTTETTRGLSDETKTVIVIITLLFATPVGIILMWLWMKWKTWIKVLITILPILFALFITIFVFAILGFVFLNPHMQKEIHKNVQVEMESIPYELPSKTFKTILHKNISLKIPDNWYLQERDENCAAVGDSKTPKELGRTIDAKNHTLIEVCHYDESILGNIPYTNGSSKNPTQRKISINGYAGIRAKAANSFFLTVERDIVLITDPKGGKAWVSLETGDQKIFDQIIESFTFIQ